MYIKINWREGLGIDHTNTPGSSCSILDTRRLCYVSVFIPKTPITDPGGFFWNILSLWAELQVQGHFDAEVRVRWRSLHDSGYNFHLEINIERQWQVFEEYFVLTPLFDFCPLNCQGALAVWSCIFSDVPNCCFFSVQLFKSWNDVFKTAHFVPGTLGICEVVFW